MIALLTARLQSLCTRWIASAKADAKTVFGHLKPRDEVFRSNLNSCCCHKGGLVMSRPCCQWSQGKLVRYRKLFLFYNVLLQRSAVTMCSLSALVEFSIPDENETEISVLIWRKVAVITLKWTDEVEFHNALWHERHKRVECLIIVLRLPYLTFTSLLIWTNNQN